jgi:hypothetical protein
VPFMKRTTSSDSMVVLILSLSSFMTLLAC